MSMDKCSISYTLIRSSRKTVAIQIGAGGEVVVRCPQRMDRAAVDAFVESRAAWIEKHRKTAQPRLPVLTQPQLRELTQQAKAVMAQRAAHFAPLVGVTYERITIRRQHTRWGSCSGKGNLNFNCLLMLTPAAVVDYVVVHELCHRKHMNHSAIFWAEVERVLPDYREAKAWLRENGTALIGRLPVE